MGDPAVAASKDGVTVKQPVLKDTGDAFWVAVEVTNTKAKPADVWAVIRLTGPLGYQVLMDVRADGLAPGATHDGVYTAQDRTEGAVVPKHLTAVIVNVTRAPT
ncbi:hypothetical protein SAMN05216252_12016 [Actinacidiphila glaucinigra]|uniref:Uncharacterized protein n=1 Tax=Actinacidiphila glaucinigra TaxID=235986 RepID=A0A239LJM0_9ACTN|nr:hypothetical protein SAMN05216252_12016 [Actinacidiphila glaucinigra]